MGELRMRTCCGCCTPDYPIGGAVLCRMEKYLVKTAEHFRNPSGKRRTSAIVWLVYEI